MTALLRPFLSRRLFLTTVATLSVVPKSIKPERFYSNGGDGTIKDTGEMSKGSENSGNTIFGKILRKEIPADIVFEDDKCIAFRDVNPIAPIHILVIPRKPIVRLSETTAADTELLGHLMVTANSVARQEGLAEPGYRLVINNGHDGGQSVDHLHLHIIGGRPMSWPPG